MDALKLELERKRKQLEDEKNTPGASRGVSVVSGRRIFSKRPLERSSNDVNGVKYNSDESSSNADSSQSTPAAPSVNHSTGPSLDTTDRKVTSEKFNSQDVKLLLRALGHPITLFGETPPSRFARLRSLDPSIPEEAFDDSVVVPVDLQPKAIHTFAPEPQLKKSRTSSPPRSSTEESKKKTSEFYDHSSSKEFRSDEYKFLYKFFKGALNEWERLLDSRDNQVIQTAQGRQEYSFFTSASSDLAPFFKLCQKRDVPDDIKSLLVELCDHVLERDFRAAGDAYMRLAVGNQQWLIGVSQVGLHERAAREKVYVGRISHVMNDETQKRYITSVKRILTVLQKLYPVDPSKQLLTT